MRYIVTVKGMRISEEVYVVEAATIEEASQSGIALATKTYSGFDPHTVEVTDVAEAQEVTVQPICTTGYIQRIL